MQRIRFVEVADRHPTLWRALAVELGSRLNQRGRFHSPPNETPRIFIGSSKESLPIANALRDQLAAEGVTVVLWSEGVFGASRFPIEDLELQLGSSDFAILVAGSEDRVASRGQESQAPRDNVILELGLFMGALGHERSFLALPSGVDVKVPSDLLGLTTLRWRSEAEPPEALKDACRDALAAIEILGPK